MNHRVHSLVGLFLSGCVIAAGCNTDKSAEPAALDVRGPEYDQPAPLLVNDAPAYSEPISAAPAQPVTFEAAQPIAPAQAATHTIQKGDTLYSIALRYYGKGAEWPKIIDANPGLQEKKLPVGKTIVIP